MAKSSKSKKPVVSATSPNKKPSPKGRKGGDKVFMQNDELYRLFVDSIKDYAILMLDPTGHVLSWNPGAELLKGYHADEIIGKHFSIFYPREDVEHGKPEMELRVATNENRFEDEGWRVRKDGSRFWANVVITALHKDAGVLMGFAKVIRDMTERRAGEDALREAEERMRSVVNHVIDGIITIDERGMVESFNPAAEKIFGYPAVEVVGRNVKMLMPEPYHSGHDGYLTNYFRTHQPKIIGIGREVEGLRSDGSTFPMELAVSEFKLAGRRFFTGIVRDITQRKQLEVERARYLENVSEAVSRLATTSTEILAIAQQQAAGAEEQASAVAQTVTTVDQVAQTAAQAAQRARGVGEAVSRTQEIGQRGRQAVDDSIAALEKLEEQVESTAESILMLAEQAQAIGEIIATVNDIAEQTNLLALNAAIEASRAGEYGRGFTVLAGEVKALASQSKKATTQVRQILGEIQKATNTAVLSTEEVTKGVSVTTAVASQAGGTIKILTETLTEAAQAATQIMASAGQQATGMSQIHQAMKNLDQVARQNLVAIRQVEQAAQNLSALGNQLTSLTRS